MNWEVLHYCGEALWVFTLWGITLGESVAHVEKNTINKKKFQYFVSSVWELCRTIIWPFLVSRNAAVKNTKALQSSEFTRVGDVPTRSGEEKNSNRKIQDVHYQNCLLPKRKYLNVIYMWLGVDLRRQSGFCMWAMRQERYWATFLLGQGLSLLLLLISLVLLTGGWRGNWVGQEAGGDVRGRVFILSFVLLNRFVISSEMIVLRNSLDAHIETVTRERKRGSSHCGLCQTVHGSDQGGRVSLIHREV